MNHKESVHLHLKVLPIKTAELITLVALSEIHKTEMNTRWSLRRSKCRGRKMITQTSVDGEKWTDLIQMLFPMASTTKVWIHVSSISSCVIYWEIWLALIVRVKSEINLLLVLFPFRTNKYVISEIKVNISVVYFRFAPSFVRNNEMALIVFNYITLFSSSSILVKTTTFWRWISIDISQVFTIYADR